MEVFLGILIGLGILVGIPALIGFTLVGVAELGQRRERARTRQIEVKQVEAEVETQPAREERELVAAGRR
ncbi:MAG: hypothetical protein SV910_08000 [Chloroflexota bacterium]|nr:hypothetical protein [Chloroflexota bacterium]